MILKFSKYHGTGNDFILVDDRKKQFLPGHDLISHICDRRFGIGADGLLILREKEDVDFEMVYYNADGSPATFCGNGSRCMVAFAMSLGLGNGGFRFLAADGLHTASIEVISENEAKVRVSMIDPVIYTHDEDYTYLNTGTFHYVKFVSDPDAVDLMQIAPSIRFDSKFAPAGTNVNFLSMRGNGLYVRTYEKGVEAETLSCGTGVTAAAIAAALRTGETDLKIHTTGGDLRVTFKKKGEKFSDVFLEGPAVKVFEGSIML